MPRPIEEVTAEDLFLLASRLETHGLFALIDVVGTGTDAEKTSKTGRLKSVIADALRFAGESK